MTILNLPEKTVERLSLYRRVLLKCLSEGKNNIFSHELANLLHITPVQVRRDLMLIGHSGTLRKGYDINRLVELIGKIIDTDVPQKVAVVGVGNLGKAIISYFNGQQTKLQMTAAFDINPDKVDRVFAGIRCYHINQMPEIIKKENITIGIITVPADQAAQIAEILVLSGVRGILNYTPTPVNVTPHAFLEEYDMITSLEKVAYFASSFQ